MPRGRGFKVDWLFTFAVLVAAGLLAIRPGLILGVLLGLLAVGVARFAAWRSDPGAASLLAAVVSASGVVGLISFAVGCGAAGERGVRSAAKAVETVRLPGFQGRPNFEVVLVVGKVELPTTVSISARYESGSKLVKVVRLEVLADALEEQAQSELLGPCDEAVTAFDLAHAVVARLKKLDWRAKTTSYRLAATKRDVVSVDVPAMLPAAARNELSVRPPDIDATLRLREPDPSYLLDALPSGVQSGDEVCSSVAINLLATERSELTLRLPNRAIGKTDPPVQETSSLPGGDQQVTVPLDQETAVAQIELRSPPFRSDPLAQLADVTVWTPFQWILGVCLAGASGAFREFLAARFRRRAAGSPERTSDPPRGG
jgi:hypothetical protein